MFHCMEISSFSKLNTLNTRVESFSQGVTPFCNSVRISGNGFRGNMCVTPVTCVGDINQSNVSCHIPANRFPYIIPPYSVKASFELIPHCIPVAGPITTTPSIETNEPAIAHIDKSIKVEEPDGESGEPMDMLSKTFMEFSTKDGYICIYCGKLYSRKYGLKIHLRTHTGYKPLKCKVCYRAFGDPSNLNKHVRLHAQGDAPYRCVHCGKVLVRRRDLARHMKSRHPNKTP